MHVVPRQIAISGELGSGKSSLASVLAERLEWRKISTGEMQREIAAGLGLSTLDANRRAEQDESIDRLIDERLVALGRESEPTVFDSRLAWHFVPGALKVHLVVDPVVGAARVMGRGATKVEAYASEEAAREAIEQRFRSERQRFRDKYDIDIGRLRNYDVVLDSTDAPIDELADEVIHALRHPAVLPRVMVSPKRVELRKYARRMGQAEVEYRRPVFVVTHGTDDIREARRDGARLLEVELVAEVDPTDDGAGGG